MRLSLAALACSLRVIAWYDLMWSLAATRTPSRTKGDVSSPLLPGSMEACYEQTRLSPIFPRNPNTPN